VRDVAVAAPFPKIELHLHVEGSVRPERLLEIARRNDHPLPVDTVDELRDLFRFRDFAHFIQTWILVTSALRTADDFREILVDYAEEAAGHGAVYLEAIFSPAERVRRGSTWDDVFGGFCDGVVEARERFGVEIRLTPDITRGFTDEEAAETVRYCAKYRDRGVVGVGLGGLEREFPPELSVEAFRLARELGLASVPHAGEVAGAASVQGAIESLHADRIRHGIRAVEDPGLVREIAGRGLVLDVCPLSNLRTGAVASLDEHPLPTLLDAGVRCSISTDDPAMFDTDLGRDYTAACTWGHSPRVFYEAGVAGALCDEATRERLRAIGEAYAWDDVEVPGTQRDIAR
jgi:aminodeoxyfutalosine deaminase